MKKIVVCPDSFKGSLTAFEAADIMAETLRSLYPSAEIVKIPLADGGEGSGDVLAHLYPIRKEKDTFDALMRSIKACYFMDNSGEEAFIDSAAVVGLTLLEEEKRNPMKATSFPLGMMIRNAVESGVKRIRIALGGSGVNDAGMGMLEALGYRFFDSSGHPVSGNGENLIKVFAIDSERVVRGLSEVEISAICDVKNPLYGTQGSAYVFSPQKGATPEMIRILDEGLRKFSSVVVENGFGQPGDVYKEGAGAAGGLGYALLSFFNGKLINGIDFMLEATDFDNKLKDADLVITGEGKIDSQSLMGKVISGVLRRCKEKNIPLIAVGGIVEDESLLKEAGISIILSISDSSLPLAENMNPRQARLNLANSLQSLSISL